MNFLDKLITNLAKKRGFIPGMFQGSPIAGGQSDPPPAEYGDYLQISSFVYACVTIRSDLLSSLPIKLYKVGAGGKKKEVTSGRAFDLLQKVNDYWTFNRLLQMTEMSLGTWGAGYWFMERGQSGKAPPTEIWFARPDRVVVRPDPVDYVAGFDYYPPGSGKPITYTRDETIWFRYPNPNDEYAPLSPLQSIRISADYALSALRTNKRLFDQGINIGGLIMPKPGSLPMEKDQATELEAKINERFGGQDKAHRWGVLRFDAEIKTMNLSPRDAEFIAGVRLSLEDIARGYKLPLDLVGGQRTFENYSASLRAAWTNAVLPEARFIASELTEQFLPAFGGEADLVEFDASEVEVLQEAETEAWTRAREQIEQGAITVNEWREDQGLDPLPWGNVWWASGGLVPINSEERPAPPTSPAPEQSPVQAEAEEEPEEEEPEEEPPARSARKALPMITLTFDEIEFKSPTYSARLLAYGSPAHQIAWRKFARKQSKWEKDFARFVKGLWERQVDSIISKLGKRAEADLAPDEPFDLTDWVTKFRREARPILTDIVEFAGEEAFDLLDIVAAFNVANPRAVAFIEARAQRFAKEVNKTTWEDLRAVLADDIKAGKPLTEIQADIKAVFERWSAVDPNAPDKLTRLEMIARTETVGALNGGTLEGYKQSGLPVKKAWLAELDQRTRDTHVQAHNDYQSTPIPVDDDFIVGAGAGQAPGQIGLAEEDINCRCTIQAVVE